MRTAAALVVAMMVALSGCGSSDDGATESASTAGGGVDAPVGAGGESPDDLADAVVPVSCGDLVALDGSLQTRSVAAIAGMLGADDDERAQLTSAVIDACTSGAAPADLAFTDFTQRRFFSLRIAEVLDATDEAAAAQGVGTRDGIEVGEVACSVAGKSANWEAEAGAIYCDLFSDDGLDGFLVAIADKDDDSWPGELIETGTPEPFADGVIRQYVDPVYDEVAYVAWEGPSFVVAVGAAGEPDTVASEATALLTEHLTEIHAAAAIDPATLFAATG
ncbi:MAG: hypothetical protein ACE367_25570 [Acidimicrobiales bacterium]